MDREGERGEIWRGRERGGEGRERVGEGEKWIESVREGREVTEGEKEKGRER